MAAAAAHDPPESYQSNTAAEKAAADQARSFRRQFAELYRDRKPLFLLPLNECGVEKHISTFIHPSRLPYQDAYYFDGCAGFISSYATYQPLDPPTEFPKTLQAPMTTLRRQSGNCFEMSMALCSLLIGVGYDAYCAVGYAAKGVTTMDETTVECPVLRGSNEPSVVDDDDRGDAKRNPYKIKPQNDLTSKFLAMMDKREEDAKEAEIRKKQEEEAAKLAEANKPEPDKLNGLRIHCWVVVLHGKREIASSFFLDASNGERYELDDERYQGIEALFNHQNYWVNMQDCGSGLKEITYDLQDSVLWEAMMSLDNDTSAVKIPAAGEEPEEEDEEDEENEEDFTVPTLELPHSWAEPIVINQLDYDSRCPSGWKSTLYKKVKLEQHGQYQNKKGVVMRLIKYNDDIWKNEVECFERFRHRADGLQERTTNKVSREVHEKFHRGHGGALREHTYKLDERGPEATRTMTFYLMGRKDDLAKREQTPTSMVEHFEGREDLLYKREVIFGARTKKFGPASEGKYRPILKIDEWFHHNPNVPATSDVELRQFHMHNERIVLKFHPAGEDVSRDELTFGKAKDDVSVFALTMDMVEHYRVHPDETTALSRLELHRMYTHLMEVREELIKTVRLSEDEVAALLREREEEEQKLELEISVYDTSRNHEAKKKRQELEAKRLEDIRIRKEKEKDYLAPFLMKLNNPERLTREQAASVRFECLESLRRRLVNQAELIQTKFEKESEELLEMQKKFHREDMGNARTVDSDAAFKEASDAAMFRVHILEKRLHRHKEIAARKFKKLEERLNADKRLRNFRHQSKVLKEKTSTDRLA